jgi:hypothetical protein
VNLRRWLLAGAAVTLTACGSTPAGPANDRVVGATPGPSGTPAAVSLHVGQLLQVSVLSLEEAEVSPPGVLVEVNAGPGVADFKAVHPGRATVTVSRGVACSPGTFCSHLMVQVGQVAVTVS